MCFGENSGVKMKRPLDLSRVKVYSNTKEDTIEALSRIGENVYMSDADDFSIYTQGKLNGVRYASDGAYTDHPYLCGNMVSIHYKYIILCEDAKFKDGKEEYYSITVNAVNTDNTVNEPRKEGLNIGNSFWIRSKDNTEVAHLVTITEISMDSKGSIASIGLGTCVLPPEELLKNYEWSKSPKENDWKPFNISLEF